MCFFSKVFETRVVETGLEGERMKNNASIRFSDYKETKDSVSQFLERNALWSWRERDLMSRSMETGDLIHESGVKPLLEGEKNVSFSIFGATF